MSLRNKRLITFVVIVSLLVIASYSFFLSFTTTNADLFRRYGADIHLEVEEGISVPEAEAVMLISLESLNQTFGYSLRLHSVKEIPNDGTVFYTDEHLEEAFWLEGMGINSLYKTKKDGRLNVIVRFVSGKAEERHYPDNVTIKPKGISNCGNRIIVFYEDLDFTLNSPNTCKVIMHEFGHAFGLQHNQKSAMMWSPEVDDGTGQPNETVHFKIITKEETFEIEGVAFEALSNHYPFLKHNGSEMWYFHSRLIEEFNLSVPIYYSEECPDVTRLMNITYNAVYNTPSFNNVTVASVSNDCRFCSSGILFVRSRVYLSYFNLNDFKGLWDEEEIRLCD